MSDAGKVQLEEIQKALDELPYLKNLKVVDSGEEDRPWGIETVSGVPVTSGMELYDAHLIANAPTWLRSLLEEREHWKQCFMDANRDWARVGNELLDERNKTDELIAQLAAKDKVLEWYANSAYCYVSDDFNNEIGEKAHSILSQYKEAEPSET